MENQKTILVVEDSSTQALALQEMFEAEGLHVHYALDGRNGVALAVKHLPDAIVLDIELPGMDGYEVAKQLKQDEQTANIPIIMLTSHQDTAALQQGMLLGIVDFIPKDIFSNAVLLETLRYLNILERKSPDEAD